jgi:hypothetical protein
MKAINLKTICGFFCWKEPRYVSVDLWDEGICPEEPERDPNSVEGYLHAHRCSRSHTGKIVANFFKVISLVLTNNQTVELNLSFHLSNLKVFKLFIIVFFPERKRSFVRNVTSGWTRNRSWDRLQRTVDFARGSDGSTLSNRNRTQASNAH